MSKPGLEPRQSIFTEVRLNEHKYMCPFLLFVLFISNCQKSITVTVVIIVKFSLFGKINEFYHFERFLIMS